MLWHSLESQTSINSNISSSDKFHHHSLLFCYLLSYQTCPGKNIFSGQILNCREEEMEGLYSLLESVKVRLRNLRKTENKRKKCWKAKKTFRDWKRNPIQAGKDIYIYMLLTFTAVFILFIYFMSLLYLYLCLYIIWLRTEYYKLVLLLVEFK